MFMALVASWAPSEAEPEPEPESLDLAQAARAAMAATEAGPPREGGSSKIIMGISVSKDGWEGR